MTVDPRAKHRESPAVHVSIAQDVDQQFYRWVEIGAEEEGVPCRSLQSGKGDAVELAHSAAQSSRLGVGVGVSGKRVALHEVHMPAGKPVLTLDVGNDLARACRLAGSNAGRLVKGTPLRFAKDEAPERESEREIARPPRAGLSQSEAQAVANAIVRVLKTRSGA